MTLRRVAILKHIFSSQRIKGGFFSVSIKRVDVDNMIGELESVRATNGGLSNVRLV